MLWYVSQYGVLSEDDVAKGAQVPADAKIVSSATTFNRVRDRLNNKQWDQLCEYLKNRKW